MVHFSDVSKMELIVWGSTMAIQFWGAPRLHSQIRSARSTAGNIKPGSTGPRIWTNLALLGQFCGFWVPLFVYLIATAWNKFRQPEWMKGHVLPPPPDVLGVDGVVVGRTVGLLVHLSGSAFGHVALKTLGDQYHAIGVSILSSCGLPYTDRWLTFSLGCR